MEHWEWPGWDHGTLGMARMGPWHSGNGQAGPGRVVLCRGGHSGQGQGWTQPWGLPRAPHLELPPGVELFQTLYRLLPVHHGGHGGALLRGTGGSAPGTGGHRARGASGGGGDMPRVGATALTQTHGCLRASWAVMRLAGLMVSIWLMRFFASGVTVSHSGEGNCGGGEGGGTGGHGGVTAAEGQPHGACVPPPPCASLTGHRGCGPKSPPVLRSCSAPQ